MKTSISQMRLFKSCRKAWYFKYLQDLVPVATTEALETGKRYHQYLEDMENGGEQFPKDFTKEAAMACAYSLYIQPHFHVIVAEQELYKDINGHTLHGFVDGLTDDGFIVEHKTTSQDISEGGEYEYNLLWDEQVLAYMSLTGLRKVYYTVCRKPTIRLKQNETEEEFYYRCREWYDTDTDKKIRMFIVERTDDEVAQFEKDFTTVCDEMQAVIDNPERIYRNCNHCNIWGRRCEYSSICLNYDPDEEYVEFIRKETNR